ncbi:MAG: YigZ family protein [Ruminococcus sp.]|jgi:uncharacterized YigZ family protein|nr:YigZ family protein [Ruminococcus sp.]
MNSYTTVAEHFSTSFTERRSEFISDISPADSVETAVAFIEQIKSSHKKASHVVYAYNIRGGFMKFSDAGEPSGTAGKPVFDVLSENSLIDTVLTVTRYFGGVLLGAGGLTRAYAKAAADACKGAKRQVFLPSIPIEVSLSYNLYGKVSTYLASNPDVRTSEPIFAENITLNILALSEKCDEILSNITEITNGQFEYVLNDEICADFV